MPPIKKYLHIILGFVAAIGLSVTIAVVDNDGAGPQPGHLTATVKLGGPGASAIPKPPTPQVKSTAAGLETGLRSESPAGVSRATLDTRQDGLEALAHHDQLPLVSPDAAPTIPGCTSRFVRNYSSRGGVRPRELVGHYTVSRNVAGWSDVWSVVSLFDRASYAASSNAVIDGEGHCAYIVRDTDKAWTQAAANPFSFSIEFIAYGDEGHLTAAQLKRGGEVFAYEARKWDIPVRLGAVRDCLPQRSGIVDHSMLGNCGGGHHDLKPLNGGWGASDAHRLAPVIAATQAAMPRAITATDRVTCRKLNWWRTNGRPHGKPEANAVRRRTALEARHVACTARGPVRAG